MVHKTTRHAAQDAVSDSISNDDVRDKIKQITLDALTKQTLDRDNIKLVLESVFTGVHDGLNGSGERMKPVLEAALKGVDDALSKSALAAKLAAEEILAGTDKFAKVDLKHSIDDLRAIEDLLFESISMVTKRSGSLASKTLQELASHYKNTGTIVGKNALDAIQSLTSATEVMSRHGINEVAQASKDLAGHLASLTSGILAGMAEAVKPKNKS